MADYEFFEIALDRLGRALQRGDGVIAVQVTLGALEILDHVPWDRPMIARMADSLNSILLALRHDSDDDPASLLEQLRLMLAQAQRQ